MQFSTESVRDLARLLNETGLHEISLQTVADDRTPLRLTVRGNVSQARAPRPTNPILAAADETPSGTTPKSVAQNGVEAATMEALRPSVLVGANAVGLFRPLAMPLQIGDEVRAGQVVAVVESLKIPNEVKSSASGRIAEVLAEDGQGVEYGQTLFIVESAA